MKHVIKITNFASTFTAKFINTYAVQVQSSIKSQMSFILKIICILNLHHNIQKKCKGSRITDYIIMH